MRSIKLHWLFLAAVLPGLAALVFFTVASYQRQYADLQQHTLLTARALSLAVDREILGAQKTLAAIAVNSEVLDRKDFARFDQAARAVLQQADLGDYLLLTDESGQEMVNTFRPFGEALPRTRNLERVRKVFSTGQPYVSNLIVGTVSGLPLISIDYPVIRQGKVVYDLNMVMLSGRLNRILKDQALPPNWIAVIYDRNGVIAARSHAPEKFVGQKVVPALLEGLSGPAEMLGQGLSLEGVASTAAASRSGKTGYSVAVGVPTETLKIELHQQLVKTLLAVAAIILASLLLAWRFGGQLRASLRSLALSVEAAATGRTDLGLPADGPAEVIHVARRFQDVLQAREQYFRFFRLTTEPMCIADPYGCFKMVNPAFLRLTGFEENELLAKPFIDFVLPEDRQKTAEEMRLQVETRPSMNFENRYVCKDGRLALLSWRAYFDKDDQLTYAVASDITEARRVSDALFESRTQLEAVIDSTADLIWSVDPKHFGLLMFNHGLHDYFLRERGMDITPGMRPEDLFTDAEYVRTWHALYHRALSEGPYSVEYRTSAGTRTLLLNINPLRHGDEVFGVSVFGKDITVQKQSEQDLRESESRFREIFNAVNDAIFIHDAKTGQIVDVNRRMCEMYGYSREQALGCELGDIGSGTPPYSSAEAMEKIARTVTEGPQTFDWLTRARDGHYFWVEVSLRRALIGSHHWVLAMVRDITERKQAEAELVSHRDHLEELVNERTHQLVQAKKAAEAANVAKGAFLANMSHEIRTPLNAILGMAHLLRRDGVTPAQAERLEHIDAASKHLLRIINDILDLSKIESGKLALEDADISIGHLLDNITSILTPRALDKGLVLVMDEAPLPPHLRGDPTRLTQALLNYADNALKFTNHGTVTLRTRIVEETDVRVLLRFEVEDTGLGIAPEHQDRLFSAFEQVDNSNTRKYGGTGLGLAITRQLALLMDGQAGFESTFGKGSTFWFTAWLAKACQDTTAVLPPSSQENPEVILARDHGGRHVLLAEDDPVNQTIVGELLRDLGLVIDVADDGEEAVELASRHDYDLILMDMQMPRMDGVEAARRIRRQPGRESVPILAMTANAFTEDRQRCLAAGMDDHLAKPVMPEVLYAAVAKWLARPR